VRKLSWKAQTMGLRGCLTTLNTSQETLPAVHPALHHTSLGSTGKCGLPHSGTMT
jgi:hypothetical protein